METRQRTAALTVIVVALVVATVLVVRDAVDATGRPDREGVVEVVMQDYRIEPATLTLPAGEPVRLVFVNQDEVSHHVTFGRDVVEEDRRDVGFAEDLFAGLEPRVSPVGAQVELPPPYRGFTVLVRGGQTVTIDVTLPEDRVGTWQAGCFTARGCYYRAGLAAQIVVE
jgi:plastocyanin